MRIVSRNRELIFSSQSSNPNIVNWDGLAGNTQFGTDFSEMFRSKRAHAEHGDRSQESSYFLQLSFRERQTIGPVKEFAQGDDGKKQEICGG